MLVIAMQSFKMVILGLRFHEMQKLQKFEEVTVKILFLFRQSHRYQFELPNEPRMMSIGFELIVNLMVTHAHVILVFILDYMPCHKPLKHRVTT